MIRINVLPAHDLGRITLAEDLSFDELAELLANPTAESKAEQPRVIGAKFSGDHRQNSDCLERNILPLDLDEGDLSFEQAVEKIRRMNLLAVVHTTASHKRVTDKNPNAGPRLRAFVVLSRPLTAAEWPRAQAWMRQNWNQDDNAIDLSRISYGPVIAEDYECAAIRGRPLDVSTLPEASAPPQVQTADAKDTARVQRLTELFLSAYPRKGLRHGFFLALTGFCAKQQLPASECKALVIRLTTETGAEHELAKRVTMVDRTYADPERGAGETKLVDILVESVGEGANAIVMAAARLMLGAGDREEQESKPRAARRKPSQDHQYKYLVVPAASGERVATTLNTQAQLLITHEDWAGVWQYDLFSDKYVAVDPPMPLDAERVGLSKDDITLVQIWFLSQGYKASREDVEAAIRIACKQRKFHPVREFLQECTPRRGAIEQIARTVLGTDDPLQIRELRCFMVGAAKRIMSADPGGIKMDTALVLQGKQGRKKTSFCQALFNGWVLEDVPALDSVQAVRSLRGKWCVELAELDKILRADPETVKAFISRKRDTLDEKFERERQVPRQCVFVGTTNRSDFLRDETGDRRWWVIPVARIRLENLSETLVAEAWGEAYEAARAGEQHWLTEEEELQLKEQQEDFRMVDPLEAPVTAYLLGKQEVTWEDVLRHVTIAHEYAVRAGKGSLDSRVSKVLERLGCEKKRTKNARVWRVPDKYAKQPTPNPLLKAVK